MRVSASMADVASLWESSDQGAPLSIMLVFRRNPEGQKRMPKVSANDLSRRSGSKVRRLS